MQTPVSQRKYCNAGQSVAFTHQERLKQTFPSPGSLLKIVRAQASFILFYIYFNMAPSFLDQLSENAGLLIFAKQREIISVLSFLFAC